VPKSLTHHTTHSIDVAASAEAVGRIIADAGSWPLYFGPSVHVEILERAAGTERLQIWATVNGDVRTWTSRRTLDPAGRRISFRQEISQPPVESMSGEWVITPAEGGGCRLDLLHDFQVVDNDTSGVEWVNTALDRNSTAELAGVRDLAGIADRLDELTFSFEDTVPIAGRGADVYEFLYRADLWPERLPHVARLSLTEEKPGLQVLSMDTRTPDGSVHTTESVRVCFEPDRIVYKQTTVPALMRAHTGCWTVRGEDGALLVTSRHSVIISPDTVTQVLGPDKSLADAVAFVHHALSTNSTVTLHRARALAERAHV
jgi:aromatase